MRSLRASSPLFAVIVLSSSVLVGQGCSSSSPSTSDGPTAGAAPLGGASPVAGSGSTSGGAGTGGAVAAGSGGLGGQAGGGASSTNGGETATTGGVSGGGTGGQAGQSGAPANPREAASALDGFTLLKPCVEPNFKGCCCEETPESENQHITKQFGGDANVTYQVKLRIAGVSERYWYEDGQLDETSKLFYTGGLPTIHGAQAPNANLKPGQGACKIHPPETDAQFKLPFTVPDEIRPQDGCYNGFNVFAMVVSTPAGKKAYYLNYTNAFDGADRQPHAAYKNDYTVTIAIPGQAQLDFYTIDGDHHQVANDGVMQVPNVKTPQPYNGNFLEFSVLDVTAAPI